MASTYGRLLTSGGYVRVFAAGLGSTLGSAIASVCIIWIVWTSTGSALDLAYLGTAGLAANLAFSVFGGAFADRFDRRRLMVSSDLARAAALAVVVATFLTYGFNFAIFLAGSAIVGAFNVVFNPAEQAVIPALVGNDQVANANGLVRSSRSGAQFVGASLGGLLIVTVGGLTGIALNVGTFLLSATLLTGLTFRSAPARATVPAAGVRGYFGDIRAGFQWLYRATGFLQLTVSATFFNFCSSIVSTFLVVFATLVLHGSALVFAALLAAEVAGFAVGSLLVSPLHGERKAGLAWTVPYGIVSGALAVVLALFPAVPLAVVLLFVLGVLGGFAGTAWLTAAQLLVPTEMQGRYFGIDNLGSVAILPIAQVGGALLIGAWGTQTTYLIAGLLWTLAGAVFLVPRALRRLGYPPTPEDAASFRTVASAADTSRSPEGTPGDPARAT